MKLVTKYQISAINSCWETCACMFNVYKSRQTGSRNLTGPKTLPKYQISAINSYTKFWKKKLFQHFANLIKIRSTHLLPIFYLFFWSLVCRSNYSPLRVASGVSMNTLFEIYTNWVYWQRDSGASKWIFATIKSTINGVKFSNTIHLSPK
jgi:hypothetical protein